MYFNVISYPSSIARIIRDFCSFSWKPDITLVWAGNKIWCNQSDWNFYQKYISSRPHIAENFRSKGPTEVKSHFWWGMGVEQGGKSEVSILQRTPCTPRLCRSYPSEFFSYFKSTTNLIRYMSQSRANAILSDNKDKILRCTPIVLPTRSTVKYLGFIVG